MINISVAQAKVHCKARYEIPSYLGKEKIEITTHCFSALPQFVTLLPSFVDSLGNTKSTARRNEDNSCEHTVGLRWGRREPQSFCTVSDHYMTGKDLSCCAALLGPGTNPENMKSGEVEGNSEERSHLTSRERGSTLSSITCASTTCTLLMQCWNCKSWELFPGVQAHNSTKISFLIQPAKIFCMQIISIKSDYLLVHIK